MAFRKQGELRVPCEVCGGCGRRPLTQAQAAAVTAVGQEWSTSAEVAARLTTHSKWPALCNLLRMLHESGVIERRAWSGRRYQWRVTQALQQAA